MNPTAIFLIALALAMDTFAVSIASGISARHFRVRHALTMGAWFGGFQALMPLLGWAGGARLRTLIGGFDHWVAFVLLFLVGAKMIYEACKLQEVENRPPVPETRIMFLLALATSIDAFAVGVSFAMVKVPVVLPVLIIGLVTFLISVAGVWIGTRGVRFFEKKIEIVGGVILMAIGIGILVSHFCGKT